MNLSTVIILQTLTKFLVTSTWYAIGEINIYYTIKNKVYGNFDEINRLFKTYNLKLNIGNENPILTFYNYLSTLNYDFTPFADKNYSKFENFMGLIVSHLKDDKFGGENVNYLRLMLSLFANKYYQFNISGLIIGDKIISSILGPTSFYFLKPNKESLVEYKNIGIKLPLMIFFGDVHQTEEKTGCDSNCYEIDDPKFLKILDSLSTKENPVDLYLEAEFEHYVLRDSEYWIALANKKASRRQGMLSYLQDKYRSCFFKNYKTKYQKYQCPAPNIRWHAIDVRRSSIKFNKWSIENKIYESKNTLSRNRFNTLMFNDLINKTDFFINEFFDLNNEDWKNTSLIYKQIRKGKISFETWKELFRQYYNQIIIPQIIYYLKKTNRYNFLKTLFDIYQKYSSLSEKEKKEYIKNDGENNITRIKKILTKLNTMIMDMYFITRMFKSPKNDNMAYLNISYMGNFHTQNIVSFLTRIIKTHTIKEEMGQVYDFKGYLDLPNINLTDEIYEYNQLISKYSLNDIFEYSPEELDKFISQFTQEKYEILADKQYMTMYYLYKKCIY